MAKWLFDTSDTLRPCRAAGNRGSARATRIPSIRIAPSSRPYRFDKPQAHVGRAIGPQPPTGRLLFSTPKSLLVAGCGLAAMGLATMSFHDNFSNRLVVVFVGNAHRDRCFPGPVHFDAVVVFQGIGKAGGGLDHHP